MFDRQYIGMQRLSSKALQRGLGVGGQKGGFGAEAGAIDLVAHERVADRGQMDANLVGAAGFQPAGEEARHRRFGSGFRPCRGRGRRLAGIALQNLPMGDGRAAAARTAMRSRAWGWRPIGLSMVPLGRSGAPQTKAR